MKSARELFEELGYDLVREDKEYLKYQKHQGYTIEFDLLEQTFYAYDDYMQYSCIDINIKELQAINQMVNELGWLDE